MRARRHLSTTALVLALTLGCARQESAPVTNSPAPPTTPAAVQTPSLKAGEEWTRPPEIQENISVERCHVGANAKQQYFLMRQRNPAKPADKHGLVVIVPGGPGTADFLRSARTS
jgi:hypothetical protein